MTDKRPTKKVHQKDDEPKEGLKDLETLKAKWEKSFSKVIGTVYPDAWDKMFSEIALLIDGKEKEIDRMEDELAENREELFKAIEQKEKECDLKLNVIKKRDKRISELSAEVERLNTQIAELKKIIDRRAYTRNCNICPCMERCCQRDSDNADYRKEIVKAVEKIRFCKNELRITEREAGIKLDAQQNEIEDLKNRLKAIGALDELKKGIKGAKGIERLTLTDEKITRIIKLFADGIDNEYGGINGHDTSLFDTWADAIKAVRRILNEPFLEKGSEGAKG